MEESKARKLLVDTGRELLETGLVARTWGNISCRLDRDSIVITPSGLDYTITGEEDIVQMNLRTGQYQGIHKPSGERRIHIAAYQIFPEVNFVIHTHQTYATALGLAGFTNMDITKEEEAMLGGIRLADYGLPGTKKLTNAVKVALQTGAKVVLMRHHGVLICGANQEETMSKAILLEEICKRNVKGSFEVTQKIQDKEVKALDQEAKALVQEAEILDQETFDQEVEVPDQSTEVLENEAEVLLNAVRKKYQYAALIQTPAALICANRGIPIYAQVDDMAQMIGRKIPLISSNPTDVIHALEKANALLVPGMGAIVRAEAEDDTKALGLLLDKAAICSIHTAALNVKARIGVIDAAIMKFVYQKKYSKQKYG